MGTGIDTLEMDRPPSEECDKQMTREVKALGQYTVMHTDAKHTTR